MIVPIGLRQLMYICEQKALRAFQRAAQDIPAYREFLKENNVSPSRIRNIEDFKKHVPVLDKDKTFRRHAGDIKKLLRGGSIKNITGVVSSSGASGCFSYGLPSAAQSKKGERLLDTLLEKMFGVSKKKTLLINSLPMGVRFTSRRVTIAETSVRPDIVLGLIRTFGPVFDQVILVGENAFVKRVLEEGAESGLDWRQRNIHLVLGEELLAENLRTYLAGLIGSDPDEPRSPKLIGSSFGAAEFGLNIFFETPELIWIRRLMQRDRKLREILAAPDTENLPALFHFHPMRTYVETIPKAGGADDIVLTSLEKEALTGLVRYNIRDEGKLIAPQRLKEILADCGYGATAPILPLPVVAVWGRDRYVLENGKMLRPEFIKELLYQDKEIAASVTGNFRLSKAKCGLRIEIQKQKSSPRDERLEQKIRGLLTADVPGPLELIIYPHEEFPCQMELNYEKKFRYI